MRKLVDANYLKSEKLREYLSDRANIAVIPDYVMMEALASGDPKNICERFKILGEHPDQVRILKSTYGYQWPACEVAKPRPAKAPNRERPDREFQAVLRHA